MPDLMRWSRMDKGRVMTGAAGSRYLEAASGRSESWCALRMRWRPEVGGARLATRVMRKR
jgi:hypothetical protein